MPAIPEEINAVLDWSDVSPGDWDDVLALTNESTTGTPESPDETGAVTPSYDPFLLANAPSGREAAEQLLRSRSVHT